MDTLNTVQTVPPLLARLDEQELPSVERCVESARRLRLVGAARAITRAGNGWVYPIASVFLFFTPLHNATRCLIAAALSLAVAFGIYPRLKHAIARHRPCHTLTRLSAGVAPLDRYSFPSGHAMTAAAFGVPIIAAAPVVSIPIVAAGCLLVSWSRVALGHHYWTDILAGTMIGAVIAAAVSAFVL